MAKRHSKSPCIQFNITWTFHCLCLCYWLSVGAFWDLSACYIITPVGGNQWVSHWIIYSTTSLKTQGNITLLIILVVWILSYHFCPSIDSPCNPTFSSTEKVHKGIYRLLFTYKHWLTYIHIENSKYGQKQAQSCICLRHENKSLAFQFMFTVLDVLRYIKR